VAKATKASTAPKKADLSEFGKKPYKVGADVVINAEIAGCRPGTICKVTEIKESGAMFRVKVCKGLKADKEFPVWANQLD